MCVQIVLLANWTLVQWKEWYSLVHPWWRGRNNITSMKCHGWNSYEAVDSIGHHNWVKVLWQLMFEASVDKLPVGIFSWSKLRTTSEVYPEKNFMQFRALEVPIQGPNRAQKSRQQPCWMFWQLLVYILSIPWCIAHSQQKSLPNPIFLLTQYLGQQCPYIGVSSWKHSPLKM